MSLITLLGFFKQKAVLYIAGALIATLALIYWHKSGVNKAVANERQRLTLAYKQAEDEAITRAIASADEAIKQANIESEKQNAKIKSDAASLVAQYRSGAMRLSVPARCQSPVVGGAETNTSAFTSEARAELSDPAVEFFVSEAKRADEAVISHNELIDIIEKLKASK